MRYLPVIVQHSDPKGRQQVQPKPLEVCVFARKAVQVPLR